MYMYAQRWKQNMTRDFGRVVTWWSLSGSPGNVPAGEEDGTSRERIRGSSLVLFFLDRTSRRMVSVSSEPARFPTGMFSCATLPGSLPSAGRDADTTVRRIPRRAAGAVPNEGTTYPHHGSALRTYADCGRRGPRRRPPSPHGPPAGPAGPDGKGVFRRAPFELHGSCAGAGGCHGPGPPGGFGKLPPGGGGYLPADRGEAA